MTVQILSNTHDRTMSTENNSEVTVELIYRYGVAVITATLINFEEYSGLETFVGHLPVQVGRLLIILAGLYVVVVNRKPRRELLE